MTTISLTRQRQAVELALNHARSRTPRSYRMTEPQLDMLCNDLTAAVETLRENERRESDAAEFARKVIR